jgi:hypothetical protein
MCKKLLKILLAALIFAVIAQLIHSLAVFIEMPYYLDQNYFSVWSKLMMPTAGPPPASFTYYSLAFNLIIGITLAFVYNLVSKGLPGRGIKKGLVFGLISATISIVSSSLSFILLVNLPIMLIVYWAIENLIIYLITGMIFYKILK